MKIILKRLLQRILGFENYLYVFSRYVIATLKWNRKEKDFLQFLNLLPDSGIILDIGANIGAMTVHLSKKLKQSRVYAFEPVPCNINTLKRIVKHYRLPNVTIMETALGNTCGEVTMVLPSEKKVRLHGLSHVVHESITDYNSGDHFVTSLTTLDSMKELTNGKPVTGIKIDVENYEFFVLDGAKKIISRDHPIIYSELWENENREKCFELLTGLNYNIRIIESGKLVDYNKTIHKTQNFFFIP